MSSYGQQFEANRNDALAARTKAVNDLIPYFITDVQSAIEKLSKEDLTRTSFAIRVMEILTTGSYMSARGYWPRVAANSNGRPIGSELARYAQAFEEFGNNNDLNVHYEYVNDNFDDIRIIADFSSVSINAENRKQAEEAKRLKEEEQAKREQEEKLLEEAEAAKRAVLAQAAATAGTEAKTNQ